MKPSMLYHQILIALILTAALVMQASSQSTLRKPGNPAELLKNFVYIEGEGSIRSFYISRYEVSNWEYLVYLEWLRTVFVEYPEVVEAAIPDTSVTGGMLWNPRYYCCPVTGINWEQANDFCLWLTDRINEYLLVQNEILFADPFGQLGAVNFNTEAFLAGQYIGLLDKNSFDAVTGEKKLIGWTDGILLPACRLPVESEWEYAFSLNNKGMIKSPAQKATDERILNQNPLYMWYEYYTEPERGSFFDAGNVDQDPDAFSADKTQTCSKVYDNDEKLGIHNMGDNISEWVFDRYVPGKSTDNADLLSIYTANGQAVVGDIETEMDRQKDRSGRMPYITLFVDDNGNPVYVGATSPYLRDNDTGAGDEAERVYRGGSYETDGGDARGHGSQGSGYRTVGFRYVISATGYAK